MVYIYNNCSYGREGKGEGKERDVLSLYRCHVAGERQFEKPGT